MVIYNLSIANTQVQWSEEQVTQKLEAIRNLSGKSYGWVRTDLEVVQSWLITRIIWTVIIKHFLLLREVFFGVNLTVSQSILYQLQPQVNHNPALQILLREAIGKFVGIRSNHSIGLTPLVQDVPLYSTIPPAVDVQRTINHPSPPLDNPVSSLIPFYEQHWNSETKQFNNIPFNANEFKNLLSRHNHEFPLKHNPKKEFGVIEKKDLRAGSQMAIRADIHGDLLSLLVLVKRLQTEGLLDHEFRCKPNVYLTFLGDYVDRGPHQFQVLQLLTSLRMENPNQVTLIRGNHEDIESNRRNNSPLYDTDDSESQQLLEDLYQSFPLSMYFSQSNETSQREYVHCTHAMFEPHIDPAPLLDSSKDEDFLIIPKGTTELSPRIRQMLLYDNEDPLKIAASKIENITVDHCLHNRKINDPKNKIKEPTAYNWGDIDSVNGTEPSNKLGPLGKIDKKTHQRTWKITPEIVEAYQIVSSSKQNTVQFMFRGHQHRQAHHYANDRMIATTLPIAMDANPKYIKMYRDQKDTAYILRIATKVENWTKRVFLREPRTFSAHITSPQPIKSEEI